MATIQDFNENLKVKIIPSYTNWWHFDFEFSYDGKNVFNPEVLGQKVFWADDYHSLLDVLEKAIDSKENKEKFFWGAWEDEASIEVVSFAKGDNESENWFEITFNFGNAQFLGGEISYGFYPLSIRICANQKDFRSFYKELNNEMLPIYDNLPEDHKGEGNRSRPKKL